MADDAVCRLHVTDLGCTVMAFSAVGVSQPRMEIGWQVALFAGVGVVGKSLCCSRRGRSAAALGVAAETVSTKTGIMSLY